MKAGGREAGRLAVTACSVLLVVGCSKVDSSGPARTGEIAPSNDVGPAVAGHESEKRPTVVQTKALPESGSPAVQRRSLPQQRADCIERGDIAVCWALCRSIASAASFSYGMVLRADATACQKVKDAEGKETPEIAYYLSLVTEATEGLDKAYPAMRKSCSDGFEPACKAIQFRHPLLVAEWHFEQNLGRDEFRVTCKCTNQGQRELDGTFCLSLFDKDDFLLHSEEDKGYDLQVGGKQMVTISGMLDRGMLKKVDHVTVGPSERGCSDRPRSAAEVHLPTVRLPYPPLQLAEP